jgi:predicted Zn-dependent protease with MMP-like domain
VLNHEFVLKDQPILYLIQVIVLFACVVEEKLNKSIQIQLVHKTFIHFFVDTEDVHKFKSNKLKAFV